jgi:hypothetical protein
VGRELGLLLGGWGSTGALSAALGVALRGCRWGQHQGSVLGPALGAALGSALGEALGHGDALGDNTGRCTRSCTGQNTRTALGTRRHFCWDWHWARPGCGNWVHYSATSSVLPVEGARTAALVARGAHTRCTRRCWDGTRAARASTGISTGTRTGGSARSQHSEKHWAHHSATPRDNTGQMHSVLHWAKLGAALGQHSEMHLGHCWDGTGPSTRCSAGSTTRRQTPTVGRGSGLLSEARSTG